MWKTGSDYITWSHVFLTPNELNIDLSCVVMIFDLESSLERNVISYFYIRSCLIVYGFFVHTAITTSDTMLCCRKQRCTNGSN